MSINKFYHSFLHYTEQKLFSSNSSHRREAQLHLEYLTSSSVLNFYHEHLHSSRSKQRQEHLHCWSYMAELRSNSLCRTCSGRSEKFFFQDKAVVDLEACSSIVDRCALSFRRISAFIKKLDKFLEGLNDLLHSRCVVFLRELAKMRTVSQSLINSNIFKLIASVLHPNTEDPHDQKLLEAKSMVCEKLVTIGHETFIEQVSTLLSSTASMLTALIEHLNERLKNNFEATPTATSQPFVSNSPIPTTSSRKLSDLSMWHLPSISALDTHRIKEHPSAPEGIESGEPLTPLNQQTLLQMVLTDRSSQIEGDCLIYRTGQYYSHQDTASHSRFIAVGRKGATQECLVIIDTTDHFP